MSILNNLFYNNKKLNKDIVKIIKNYLLPSVLTIRINKIIFQEELLDCTRMIQWLLNDFNAISKDGRLKNRICNNGQHSWTILNNY